MNKITCGTTLRNYGWQEGWYVEDGGMRGSKRLVYEKLKWIEQQGISSDCVETMGGWSFRTEQAAMQFALVWL